MAPHHNVSYLKTLMEIDPTALTSSLKVFIRDSMENLEREGIIVGLSGVIDPVPTSAVNLVGKINGDATLLRNAKGAEEIRIEHG